MNKEKPISMSLKDWLIRNVAEQLEIDEDICDKVVNWSYKQARDAAREHNVIELSGFGKLMVTPGKMKRKISKISNRVATLKEKVLEDPDMKPLLIATEEYLNKLNSRYDEMVRNFGRMEK